MHAIVTGVAGFIGGHLADRLLAEGVRVTGIDCLTDYYSTQVKESNVRELLRKGLDFRRADLCDLDLSELGNDVEVVYHLAGQPGVRSSWGSEFADYCDRNILATQRLLEWSRDQKQLQRFVYASSSSVYGDAESFPTRESDLPRPRSPYGVSKLAAEHLCSLYANNFGVPAVSLRYFTVYGPRQRPDMAFTRFCLAASAGEVIHVYGDGQQRRDFTYVEDIVEANLLAASAPVSPGSVFNVSGGSNASVREVLSILEVLAGKPLRVSYSDAVAGDVTKTSGSVELAASVLGWSPKVGLSSGLARQYEWARVFANS